MSVDKCAPDGVKSTVPHSFRWHLSNPLCFHRLWQWRWGGEQHGADVRLSAHVHRYRAESRPEEWGGCRGCSPQAFQRGTSSWAQACERVRGLRGWGTRSCRRGSCELAVSPPCVELVFFSHERGGCTVFTVLQLRQPPPALFWESNLKIDFHWI